MFPCSQGNLPTGVSKRRMHIFYSGRVQGVGFRYTVKGLTPGFELTGVVRNLPDGRVELVAEGDEQELIAFQKAVRDSGVGPLISKEEVGWSESENKFKGFEIVG